MDSYLLFIVNKGFESLHKIYIASNSTPKCHLGDDVEIINIVMIKTWIQHNGMCLRGDLTRVSGGEKVGFNDR
jgi:hypothetical protein